MIAKGALSSYKTMSQRPAIIFYVEHNQMLLQTVRDVLEFAGWYVRPC